MMDIKNRSNAWPWSIGVMVVSIVAAITLSGMWQQDEQTKRAIIAADAAELAAALKQNQQAMEVKRQRHMAYFLKMQCPGPEHKRRSIYIETPEGGSFFCFGPKGTAPTSKPDKRNRR